MRIKEENRKDLMVWKRILQHQSVFTRSFMDIDPVPATEINMYSDASGTIGFGALCGTSWMYGQWSEKFLSYKPSIEYQELYAVTTGIVTWIRRFMNKRIILFCDNISAVCMINKSAAKCKNCMVLIRLIMVECMQHNVKVNAKYVPSKQNVLSDALSRLDFKRFWKHGRHMESENTAPPADMWPPESIWVQ